MFIGAKGVHSKTASKHCPMDMWSGYVKVSLTATPIENKLRQQSSLFYEVRKTKLKPLEVPIFEINTGKLL